MTGPVVELRLPVDATEAPLGYEDHDGHLAIELLLTGGGYTTLLLPVGHARTWAADLFAAVTQAHGEAVGDPHHLTDSDLAAWGDPNAYTPAATLTLTGTPAQPAQMRFSVALTITGTHLTDSHLRAAIVQALTGQLNTVHVAVSHGHPAPDHPGPATP